MKYNVMFKEIPEMKVVSVRKVIFNRLESNK